LYLTIYFITGSILFTLPSVAQQTKNISGKITDAQTGEPIPYVTVSVKIPGRANLATSTNFDGFFHLTIPFRTDSVYVSYVSYLPAKKPLALIPEIKNVDFQLSPDNRILNEVRVTPKSYVNPAWEIMENMVKHKSGNNIENLDSYQYQSYNRIDLALNGLSDKMKRKKAMRQLLPLMDSLKALAGSNGTPVLPIFTSETVSDVVSQRSPKHRTENVISTHVNGVGLEDGTLISQIVSAGFQQYNFYDNFLRIAGKDFISPLSDSWKTFYDYELIERNDKIDGSYYYKIAFKPKRAHDLAFSGIFWLTQDSYALYRIDVLSSPDANIQFLNKIRIQEEMTPIPGSAILAPRLTRIVVDVNNLIKSQSGFIGQFYIANTNYAVNKTYPAGIFKEQLTVSADANKKDDRYWNKYRPDTLNAENKRIAQLIDTVKNLPLVRTYADLIGMVINGYYRVGKFGFGPYIYTYSYNDLEGSAIRIGGETNHYFSNKVILGGYLSYAFRDKKWSYNAAADYIFSRKTWTEGRISYTRDIEQTGYQFENFSTANNIFKASIRNGNISRRGPFIQSETQGYLQSDILKHVRAKITVDHRTFNPLFNFNYYSPVTKLHYRNYSVSEAQTEVQWSPGNRLIQSDKINKRIAVGNGTDKPVITFRYTHGFRLAAGDFDYNKYAANITQKIHMGIWGKGEYSITGGLIPSALPTPLLENPRYYFNTMRFLEYTCDRYASLNYTQHMDGLITNSLPLIKKLNLRTLLDFNILEGTLSADNNTRAFNTTHPYDRSLDGIPYMEAGYGVENVFKFLRFDFLYRLNHMDHPDQFGALPGRFALRVSLQLHL
jgi:hypothetical protein